MITLSKINLTNFLSHSDTTLNLDQNAKFLIDGISGSGKSSISESLVWCLFGKGRAENRSLIKKGTKYAKVSVILEDTRIDRETIKFNITRSITSAGKHDLSVTRKKVIDKQFLPVEVSGTKNLQEYIEKQILHSSYILFINSIVCLQNNNDNFVEQTAARRKEIILEIVNASDYDEYYVKAKDKVKELEITTGASEVAITGIENKLKEDKENLSNIPEIEEKVKKLSVDIDKNEIELKVFLKKRTDMDHIVSQKSNKEDDLIIIYDKEQSLITEIENLNREKLSFSSMDINKTKKDIEKAENELSEFKKITIKISSWNEKMMELINSAPVDMDYEKIGKRINLQIISLMKKNVEVCPEINKPCPIIVREKDSKLIELNNDLNRNAKEEDIYLKKKEEYNEQVILLGEKPVIDNAKMLGLEDHAKFLEKRLKEVEQGTTDIVINISVKEKELEIVKITKDKLIKEIEVLGLELNELKIESPSEKFYELDKEQNGLISQKQLLEQDIAITKNNIEKIEKEEETLKSMKKNIKEDQETLKSMKLLKEAFGNNGIKAIVIDYVIPKLEDCINEILGHLSDFRVRLDTQTKTISGESTKEGLFIDIITPDGEQLSYNNFSGGEKVKISSAIFSGLASLCHCNFRILDESIVALDNESVLQFVDVIEDVQKNVNQLIVISHIDSVKDMFQEKINVVKIDGNSMIEK